jgi:hypothetical protein
MTAMEIDFDSYFTVFGFLGGIQGKLSLTHSHESQFDQGPLQL